MNKRNRLLRAAALLLVIALLVSPVCVITGADHDCVGDDCPVCALLAIYRTLICVAAPAAFPVFAGFAAARMRIGAPVSQMRQNATPVALKTRLTN